MVYLVISYLWEALRHMRSKLTLEQRVTLLEKFVKTLENKSKNEALIPRGLIADVTDVFNYHFSNPDSYTDYKSFLANIRDAAVCNNDRMIDDIIMYMIDDYDYEEDQLEDLRRDITKVVSYLAEDILDDNYYDYDESLHKGSKSRLVCNRLKNEDIKQLPNGRMASGVNDVLSSWAGTSSYKSDEAIAKLSRSGILNKAVNMYYKTPEEVAAAVKECWYDDIGNGEGAAKFFIGDFDGELRCALTLFPVSGGASRARQLTLKFIWPKTDM